MARVNNLSNFLTDVASAIKTKKGSETNIPAANFDTEILALPSQGVYEQRVLNISANGTQTITPSSGYDAIDELELTIAVPEKQLQSKTYNFAQNTNIQLLPDSGYDGFDTVTLNINVPSSQINNQDKTITQNGTYTADSGYTGLGEVTVNVPSLDTSDATATRDDILYPKTAYVKEQKITGNIQPHYAADSVTLYQNYDLGRVGNTYQSGVSIHLEDYIFSYYKLSNVYYIQAINANTHQIEATQSYTVTDLFNNNENNNVLLTYDNYNNTEYTLVLAKGRNNGNGDTRIWARRVKFTVSTKQFTLIDGIAEGYWGDTGNNYGFAAVGTQMTPNNFGVLYSYWEHNLGFAFAGITWTDTTGSIYSRANKSRIIPYSYGLEETGNGRIFSTPRAFIVINPTLTNYTYVNTSGYSYVSHDLRYMIYNRYLYRVTYNDNASTMFNSKVQIGTTQLPNYSWVRFSEDDSYIVLNSNGSNYMYTFDENGFISAQVINNVNQTLTGTDSDFQLINDTSTNLHLYKYDKGEVLTSVDIKGISYQHIEGQNVPANSNLVVNGIRYMGLNGVEVGSMPNNGQLTYTPTESTQSIPEGYTSGGTIEAWTSASEYQTCLDITEAILGQGDDV